MKGDGRDVLQNNIYLYISAFFDAAALSREKEIEVYILGKQKRIFCFLVCLYDT